MDDFDPKSQFVLHPDAELKPVSDFHESIRSKLGGADDEVVLSLANHRETSERITQQTASLLRQFQTPTSIAEAVLAWANRNEVAPSDVLEDAGRALIGYAGKNILVAPDHVDQAPNPLVALAPRFPAFTLLRLLNQDGSIAVIRAERADSTPVILKALMEDPKPERVLSLMQETAILDQIATSPHTTLRVPEHRCLYSETGELSALVLEFLAGEPLKSWGRYTEVDLQDRGKVAVRIAQSYRDLHSAGVLHTDVHPSNILVAPDASVSLIDFGASQKIGAESQSKRMGIQAYLEPEAMLQSSKSQGISQATLRGEQYAIATVIFELLTGHTPLDLSLEFSVARSQMLNEPPVSFSALGIDWPDVEACLSQALSKNPIERFPSTQSFCSALEAAVATQVQRLAEPAGNSAFVELRSALLGIDTWRGMLSEHGKAGLYHGAAGIALGHLELARRYGRSKDLDSAIVWAHRARQVSTDTDAFAPVGEFGIETGLLHQSSGVALVEMEVCKSQGKATSEQRHRQRLIGLLCADAKEKPTSNLTLIDITNGQSGSLFLIAKLLTSLAESETDQTAQLMQAATTISDRLDGLFENAPHWNAQKPPFLYLGFAHGLAGALFARMALAWALDSPLPVGVKQAMEWLISQSVLTEQGRFWPQRVDIPADRGWPGWCHGSAGHVLCLLAAARVMKRPDLLLVAREAGAHAFLNRRTAGQSLCCGQAGVSLILSELSADLEAHNLELAWDLKALTERLPTNRETGLFKGDAGGHLVPKSVSDVRVARFPIYSMHDAFHSGT